MSCHKCVFWRQDQSRKLLFDAKGCRVLDEAVSGACAHRVSGVDSEQGC